MSLIENLKVKNVLSKEYTNKLMELNIQLFGSSLGSGSNSTYLYSSVYPSKYPYTLAVSWKENSYSVSGNTSSVTVSGSFTADQNWWETSHQSTLAIYWYDNYTGTEKQVGYINFGGLSGKYDSKSTSATFTVQHNSDGKLSGYAKAVFTKGNTTTGYACNSGSVATATSELYNIPRQANISTAPDFNDEENPTITYENSAGSAVTSLQACISLTGSADDIKYRDINKTGTLSYTFELTEEERKLLRANTPSNNRKLFFYVRTVIGGNTYYSKLEKTFTIINADPDFHNFEFQDINEKTVALTGSNQDVVLGYSNVKATIPVSNKAIALKEATMQSYRFNNISANYSDTEDVSIISEKVTTGDFTVYAIDSRSNSSQKTKSATNVINYTPLQKNDIIAKRENGVSESVVLNFSGKINLVDFGAVENSIKTAKYRYTIAGKDAWSEYTDLELTIDEEGNFSFNNLISGDIPNVGFDINNSYNIEVIVEDELSSVPFNATLGSGIPHIAYAKNGVGIMGKYDESVGGLLQVGGKSITSADTLPIGAIVDYDGDTVPSGYEEVEEEDSGWLNLTFPNTSLFKQYNTFQTCQYRKIGDKLIFRGMIDVVTEKSNSTDVVCKMQNADYAPTINRYVCVATAGAEPDYGGYPLNIIVTSSGELKVNYCKVKSWISLDGLEIYL